MDDILPLELLQRIIRNIERKKGDLATGGHKLEDGLILRGGTSDPSSYPDTNRSSAGLRDPTLLLGSL